MKYHKILLIISLLLAVFVRLPVFENFLMPTYGNTFIHIAIVRDTIQTGYYPMNDYSYGGGIPNLYVPCYRLFISNISLLFGLDPIIVSRYVVALIGVLSALSFYVLSRRMVNGDVALLSSFLSSLSPELIIYTIRPLPQSLGMALLPFALYSILKKDYFLSFLSFSFISLLHQETAVVLVGIIFIYYHILLLKGKANKIAFYSFLVGVFVYLLWHYSVVGSINILELAQFKYHESGESPNLFDLSKGIENLPLFSRCGLLVSLFSLVGLVYALKKKKFLLISFFLLNFIAVENEALGLKVFADRFVAYLCQPLIILSAVGIYLVLGYANHSFSRG